MGIIIFSISPILLKLKIPYTDRKVIILHPSGRVCTRSIQCMVDVHIHGHIQSVGAVLKTCCRSTVSLLPFLLNDKEGEKLSAGYRSMPGTTPGKRTNLIFPAPHCFYATTKLTGKRSFPKQALYCECVHRQQS